MDNATAWLVDGGYTNVLVEVENESDVPRYEHPILTPARAHELIVRVRERSSGRLLVGTSFGGGTVPPENVIAVSDFLLVHGNGVSAPDRIRSMVDECRSRASFRGQPIVFNEDDHFDFDVPDNNMLAALDRHAGYQSVPVNWAISSERKRGFFALLKKVTGS